MRARGGTKTASVSRAQAGRIALVGQVREEAQHRQRHNRHTCLRQRNRKRTPICLLVVLAAGASSHLSVRYTLSIGPNERKDSITKQK